MAWELALEPEWDEGSDGMFAGLVEQQFLGTWAWCHGHRWAQEEQLRCCVCVSCVCWGHQPRLSPILCHFWLFLGMGRAFQPLQSTQWSLAVLRCPSGAGGDELCPLSRCPCQGTSKECSFALLKIPLTGVVQSKEQQSSCLV